MKKIIITLLLILMAFNIHADQSTKQQYKSPADILSGLKKAPEATLKGPFLLKIKSINMHNHDMHLNTMTDPNDPSNIVIEMPIYIKNQFEKMFNTDISKLFLNQNLVVTGQIKLVKKADTEDQKYSDKTPILNVISTHQLKHYD